MRVLRLALLPLLGLGLVVSEVHASPEEPTSAEVVAGVKAAYASVSSVRADFVQTVRNTAMGTEDRQKGRIAIERPRKLRVEVGTPMQSAVISDGTTLWVYSVPNKSCLETADAGGGGEMASLLEDLSRLDEIFQVSLQDDKPPKPSHTVTLVPRKSGGFKSLRLTLTRQKYHLQELVLTDQMDNVTEMDFANLKFNVDVPDSEFRFVPPAGVQVIRTPGK